MMTKKDYELIARAMRAARPINPHRLMLLQWRTDIDALCAFLAAANPAFQRVRFLAACEGASPQRRCECEHDAHFGSAPHLHPYGAQSAGVDTFLISGQRTRRCRPCLIAHTPAYTGRSRA